jgi:uncharacterized protein
MNSTRRVSLAHHAHVFPPQIKPQGTIDELLKYLDAAGIEQAVCFAPLPHEAKTLDQNTWLAGEIKNQPRLFGFGTVDFTRADVAEQVKKIAGLGFKGIKIHPPAQKLSILSPSAMAGYAAAQELNLFLTFHTGIHHSRMRDSLVVHWDEIAYEFPRLRFSMEHVGGWSFFPEALAVIANHVPPPWDNTPCNIFAGLTSVFSPKELPFWFMPVDRHQELLRQAGIRQLCFGLDFPYNDLAATRRGIETICSLGLADADVDLILGGNLRRELGLEG